MIAVRKLRLDKPPAVHLPVHRIRERIPTVEIADNTNVVRWGSKAIEVHRLGRIPGSVPVIGGGVHGES